MRHIQNILRIAVLIAFPALIQAGNAPITTISAVTACPGQTISVPVTVTNFAHIMSMTLRIEYDSTVVRFNASSTTYNSAFAGIVYSSLPVSGTTCRVKLSWANFPPVNLPNGTAIITLAFDYISGTTALTFNNTSSSGSDCEYADSTLMPLNDEPTATYYHNGQISTGMIGGSVSGGSTIYYNSSTGNLTLSGHLGSVLKWQKQYNGEGYTDIPSTAGLTVYSEIPSYTGTWNYRAVVQNSPCSAVNSSATTVTVLTPVGTSKTWNGTIGTDWKSPANWSPPGTPVSADDVIIPEGTAYSPVIINAATCNNLLVKKNATLKVNPAKNLNVGGTMTIEGP